jgi:N-carbamoyl-L-amino-acid hydrolase
MSSLISHVRVNADRLWNSLMRMAEIGATDGGGCNRQALTDEDRAGRDLFVSWACEAGCAVAVDQIGNIFASRPGREPEAEPVLIGSHLDTQPTGGRFDGVYGVMAGLEVVRTLNQFGLTTRRTIEVASWTNEEGCRFAPAMLGSGVIAGVYELEFAYARRDKSGATLGEALNRIGYLGERPARPGRYRAIFEAHIEQGPILEREGAAIGVVTGIQGAYWIDVTLRGVAAHAGPTPMEMRKDPWRVASPLIQRSFELATRHAPWGRSTVGDVEISPGSRNTVPEQLIVSIDLRHPDHAVLEAMLAELSAFAEELGSLHGIDVTLERIWHMPPTGFDRELIELVDRCAQELGLRRLRMVSGAGHDSLHTARIAPTTMIFVPCAGGLSHNELESATPSDLAAGADVLLQAAMIAASD